MINEGDDMDTTNMMTTHPPSSSPQQHYSAWHSPVPYLFGGLAAMLGLIAFALLVLACSYWKLSGHLEDGDLQGNDDVEEGGGGNTILKQQPPHQYEEKIFVIMAGQVKPTCLATPSSSRSSSFGDRSCQVNGNDEKNETTTVKNNGEDQGGVQLVQVVHGNGSNINNDHHVTSTD